MEQGLKSNSLKVNQGSFSTRLYFASLWPFHYFNKMKFLKENIFRVKRECALTFGLGHSLLRAKISVQVSGLNNKEQRLCT